MTNMKRMADWARVLVFQGRRDCGRWWVDIDRKQPKVKPYRECSAAYQRNLVQGPLWKQFNFIKEGLGGPDDMVAALCDLLRSYSAYKCANSMSVAQGRKLFGDLSPLKSELPKLFANEDADRILARAVKDTIPIEEFMTVACDTGLGQSGLRQWRRLFKKAKIQVHSEGACAAEQRRQDEIAYEVFGNIEKVEATGNENENGKGHALAFRKVVEGCVRSSLIVGDDEPEEVDSEEEFALLVRACDCDCVCDCVLQFN